MLDSMFRYCARPATINKNKMSISSKSDLMSHPEGSLPKFDASPPLTKFIFLSEDGKHFFEGEEAAQHPCVLPK